MSNKPDKIWATGNAETGSWNAQAGRMKLHMPDDWQVEYTRSDITQARIDELTEALSDAVNALDLANELLDQPENPAIPLSNQVIGRTAAAERGRTALQQSTKTGNR